MEIGAIEIAARGAALVLGGSLLAGCASHGGAAGSIGGVPDVEALLRGRPELFGDLLERADEHRIKVEVALVVDGPEGRTLARGGFDHGPDYFYPASSVKTCAVIAACQLLAELGAANDADVGLDTPLRFEPLFPGESVEERDPSHRANGLITAGHDMRKVMLVSDNAAYNRLYELAGPERIAASMAAAGLDRTRIVHRLSEFHPPEEQLMTPRVVLRPPGRDPITIEERRWSAEGNGEMSGLVLGVAHTAGGAVVDGPMDFDRKNFMALRDLLDMNVMLLDPGVHVPGRPVGSRIELPDGDRARIAEAMAGTPGASDDPAYDRAAYPDDYSKFLLPGLERVDAKRGWVVRDKVGRAYGFSVTNGQIVDPATGATLYVAATIYTNANGVVGDGVYEYGRADRFFADLGEVLGRAFFGPED